MTQKTKTTNCYNTVDIDDKQLIYVYCVTYIEPKEINLFLKEKLYVIETDGLFVIVKNVYANEYSKENIKVNISDELWLDTHVRGHMSVITQIMAVNAVVPFNFGTIYTAKVSLIEFIQKYHNEIIKSLLYVENKEEWSVKVYCDKKDIVANMSRLSEKVAAIDEEINSATPGKAYILGKKKNDIIDKEIIVIYNSYSKLIFSAFNELSEEFKLNTLLGSEVSGRSDDMILNATFFIKKENIDNFFVVSDIMLSEYDNIGLDIELTGPWPPYSFINISN